jgi:hypothetical protein
MGGVIERGRIVGTGGIIKMSGAVKTRGVVKMGGANKWGGVINHVVRRHAGRLMKSN